MKRKTNLMRLSSQTHFTKFVLQRFSSTLSQGSEDVDFRSSPGQPVKYVSTVAAHQTGEISKSSSSKPCDRVDEKRCDRRQINI